MSDEWGNAGSNKISNSEEQFTDCMQLPAFIFCNTELIIGVRKEDAIGKKPRTYDKHPYEMHNQVERLFRRIKHFRRVFTHYDKLDIVICDFHFIGTYSWFIALC